MFKIPEIHQKAEQITKINDQISVSRFININPQTWILNQLK